MEEPAQNACWKRIAPLVDQVAQAFFTPLKDQRLPSAVFETPAYQQLIIAMEKIIRCLLRKAVE
jgi:hypothetical protein